MTIRTEEEVKLIGNILTNDEESTDEELVEFFMETLQLTENDARYIVSKRDNFLDQI